ncbi:MAG: EAL domain-containing protein [Rhodoferax sp.]|nr:EAL domain-containing protein [Rhodoferax sp.]
MKSLALRLRRLIWLSGVVCCVGLGSVDVVQAREVRVGVYPNEPKIFTNSAGKPAGILIDVLNSIAAREDWTLEYVPCTWQECLDALKAGKIDLMPDVAYSGPRDQVFDFHQVPSLYSWSQIYSRAAVPMASTFDLNGKRIAVLGGSIQEEFFGGMVAGFGLKVEMVPAKTLNDVFALVSSGEADAAIANNRFGDFNAPRYKLVETPIMFQPSRLFYATAEGRNPDLLTAIDRQLAAWQQDPESEYFKILKKWRGEGPTTLVPPGVWQALGVLCALVVLLVIAAAVLRWQVKVKVRHLVAAQAKVLERTAELASERDVAQRYLDIAGVMLMALDSSGRIAMINKKGAQLLGKPEGELLGADWFAGFLPKDEQSTVRQVFNGLMSGEEKLLERYENRIVTASGEELILAWNNTLLRNESGAVVGTLSSAEDITERKQAEEKINELAFFDPLTGLPNRTLLLDRLRQAVTSSSRNGSYGALLLIDLDRFKMLNDTLGRDMGDLLLKQVAQRLITCVRTEDTVARLGGDEFVVMLASLGRSERDAATQAEAVGEKILATFNQIYPLKDVAYRITPSVGVTLFSGQPIEIEVLLKQADLAMYRSKDAGRNALRFFDPDMETVVVERAALEKDLREAVHAQQFLLHYQAQVVGDSRLTGAEVLLRWQHPQRGMVSPADFIPLAEETGLILPLGHWVLETACTQLAVWATQPEMAHLTVAVNVSAHQFRQADFVELVLTVLHKTGANPQRLKLELTESLLVSNVEEIIEKMFALKAKGVGFSLDDFGTGYSSLSYLKRLPLDQLKIDQSFVRDVLSDPNDAAIAKTIIALAQSLGLGVIAEGVESAAQRDFLASSGCHAYQGYFFSRPLPIEGFEAFAQRV